MKKIKQEGKMKIAITAKSNTLEAEIDPKFGRCAYFIIIDTETIKFEAIENPSRISGGGAGIQAGQFMSEKGVKALLTGNVGPNAFDTLQAAEIAIYTSLSGKVKEAVESFNKGQLKAIDQASVASHFGMKGGS